MSTTFDTISGSKQDAAPINLFVFSGAADSEYVAERLIRSVCLIPGTTEFGYGTTTVKNTDGSRHENAYAGGSKTDFVRSMEQLIERAPNLKHVTVMVAWHGTDLRLEYCEIKPKVENNTKNTTPYSWQVGPERRTTHPNQVVSHISGIPAFGGAPSDRSVYECIVWLKSKALNVTVCPLIVMDIPKNNNLLNPYGGGTGQPPYPWRGKITCYPAPGFSGTVDQTASAKHQVDSFFYVTKAGGFSWDNNNKVVIYRGNYNWKLNRYILHLATIANAAKADNFLIGSEMVGLNRIRSDRSTFPAIDKWIDLLSEVRQILGPTVKISYAADWSEYNSYRPDDGTGDIHFHLDKLWSHKDIDYIAINNYMKLSDWRNGKDHLDYKAGHVSIYDLNYLRSNIEGGEDYDFFYASSNDRDNQIRTPITDGAYSKPWVYRQKDFRNWWENRHIHRIDGIETTTSDWKPRSKPIVFTELGCAAISRGANQPNVFVDPKSSESGFPYYSLKIRDDLIQRAFLEAQLSYWQENNKYNMIDLNRISIWAWDARPFPDFPDAKDFWGDAANWEYGHWLNGRINIPEALVGTTTTYRYTNSAKSINYGGYKYESLPIKSGKTKIEGILERSNFEIMIPRNNDLTKLFRRFRPAHSIMLTILQGHQTDNSSLFFPHWHGQIIASKRRGEEFHIECLPSITALARTGLRRHYQYGCPYILYGPLCRANKAAATTRGTIFSTDGSKITLLSGWNKFDQNKYVTGFIEWTDHKGQIERRRILKVESNILTLSGPAIGLRKDDTINIILGCNHTVYDCRDLHKNIFNCGCCPTIPSINPIKFNANIYY